MSAAWTVPAGDKLFDTALCHKLLGTERSCLSPQPKGIEVLLLLLSSLDYKLTQ